MTDDLPSLLDVPADDASVMRLFAVAPGSPEEARLIAAATSGTIALAGEAGAQLGNVLVDPAWIELINQKDVAAMGGLEAYLRAGYDPPDPAFELLRPALETAPRHILLVLSRAFGGQAVTLRPLSAITPLAAASLLRAPPTAQPMVPDAAETPLDAIPKDLPKVPMSKGRVSGMLALAALLVMGALTLLVVWIGG